MVITQNGNGYEAGFVDDFWKPVREYWQDRTPQTEAAVRGALTLDAIRWQYLHGVPDESLVSPDTWYHDFAQVSRPGNDLVQLALFADYATNPNVANTRTNLGADLFAIAIPTTNSMYRGGQEQKAEAIRALPTWMSMRAGHPAREHLHL